MRGLCGRSIGPIRCIANPLAGQSMDPEILSAFRWRQIGPANMSGRITDVEGIPSPSKTFFVAAAAGRHLEDHQQRHHLPAPLHRRAGHLPGRHRHRSLRHHADLGRNRGGGLQKLHLPGGGIYKSTDGGLTWELKGLEETQVIARIVVHPTNPDRVWVAALGHIWDSNPERGLYRTDDGGESWELVKFVSDKAGFVDLAIHPENPDVLFASSWERVRGPYFLQSGGPGSALWKTTDGGDSWMKVEGPGWPTGEFGRIGIAISMSDPEIMYANVEAEAYEGDPAPNGLYRSNDGGMSWEKMNNVNSRPFYYSQVRVHPTNPDRVYWSTVNVSNDGGQNGGKRHSRHPRGPPRHVDGPQRSGEDDRRERRRNRHHLRPGRELHLPEHHRPGAVLRGELRDGAPLHRLRRAPGQRLLVRPQPRARVPSPTPCGQRSGAGTDSSPSRTPSIRRSCTPSPRAGAWAG